MVLQSLLSHSPLFLFGFPLLLGAAVLVGRLLRLVVHRPAHRR